MSERVLLPVIPWLRRSGLIPEEYRPQQVVLAAGLVAPAMIVTALFLFLPLFFVILLSFTEKDSFFGQPVFTLANYSDILGRYFANLATTVQLAAEAAIVDLLFGFPFAYFLVKRVQYRDLVRAAMIFPMFGALYLAFGMRFLLLPGGPLTPLLQLLGLQGVQILYGHPSVVFAMSIFTFPFMVMNIGTALSNVDPVLEEAATCLGAHPWQTFRYILLPLSRSGLLAGLLMCFGWNLGAFVEPLILGTLKEQRVLAWTLYQRGVVQFDYGLSAAMGVVLLTLAFSVTYFSLRYSRGALAA